LDQVIDRLPRPIWALGAALCAATIIAMGQRPASKLPRLDQFDAQDKVLHFLAYAGLASLVLRFFVPRRASAPVPGGVWAWAMVAVIPASVGAIDEIGQALANRGRSGDVMDWIADTAGGLVVLGIALWHRQRVRRLDQQRRLRA
jgi:VanZ family protein